MKWHSKEASKNSPIPAHMIEQSPGGTSKYQRGTYLKGKDDAEDDERVEDKVDGEEVDIEENSTHDSTLKSVFPDIRRRASMQNLHIAIKEMLALSKSQIESDKGSNDNEGEDVVEAKARLEKRRGSLIQHPLGSVERFIREGDSKFYTKENLERRKSLQNHPKIRGKYVLWWRTVLELFDDNNDGYLQKEEYMNFYGALHKVLLGDDSIGDESWKENAEEDWKRDIMSKEEDEDRGGCMDQEHFIKGLHELVDLWTVTTNVDEYLDFIDYTLTRVCEISPQTEFSFWTRTLQRLRLPTFLQQKVGNNDKMNLPQSLAHIINNSGFSAYTIDELRFEFQNVASNGKMDFEGFQKVLSRLGYQQSSNRDSGDQTHLTREAFHLFTTMQTNDQDNLDESRIEFNWPSFIQCMYVVAKRGDVNDLLCELYKIYDGPACKTQFDHLLSEKLARELLMTPVSSSKNSHEDSPVSNLEPSISNDSVSSPQSGSFLLEEKESKPLPIDVIPWGETFSEPAPKTAMTVGDSINAAQLQRASSSLSLDEDIDEEIEADRVRRRSRSNSRVLGMSSLENALS